VIGEKQAGRMRFFLATGIWLASLVALTVSYHLLTGLPDRSPWSFWNLVYPLAAWMGLLLPYASFAGGMAEWASLPPRGVMLRGFLLAAVAYGLVAYASPTGEYRVRAAEDADLAAEFPFGPKTPGALKALRSTIEARSPEAFSFSIERPLERPPNWLTYLLHSVMAIAAFAVFGALLGQQSGALTSGLSPPARRNARWALGLLSAVAFFLAEAAGGEWVRADPSNSGLLGAWLPLAVPLLELALLTTISRRRRLRVHTPAAPGIR
jgi:hypothetical protein